LRARCERGMDLGAPRDALSIACGADRVAAALRDGAARLGRPVEIVRNGSRGMAWLEPFVEVETSGERIGYGPVAPEDVPGLLTAGLLDGWATNCPEYKVMAVQVSPSNGPAEWQESYARHSEASRRILPVAAE